MEIATKSSGVEALKEVLTTMVAFLELGIELHDGIASAVETALEEARKEAPAPTAPVRTERELIANYLATAPNWRIRQDLIEARGAQAVAVLCTKLNAQLAALGKLRPVVQGRNGRSGNGHAAPGQLALDI